MNAIVTICALLGLAAQLAVAPAAAAEERRVALVVGNSAYRNAPALPNTVNDAQDMAASLRKVGFEVVDGVNLDKRGMDEALTRFARLAHDADAVMFYYAGHGLQFNGENYLVPVEARVVDEVSVQYETTRLNDVVTALGFAKGVKIMVLDACRNNPFVGQLARKQATRGFAVGNGLAPIARAQGMVTAYATQANDVAADGSGRNSPFTAALVQEIQQPGLEIATMFRRVQKVVYDATGGRQTPELSLSLLGDFYINREETDIDVWRKIRASDDSALLNGFIQRFPTSFFTVDARTRLDLIERRLTEQNDRERIALQFAARERQLLERLEQAEKSRQQAATELARRESEPPLPTPPANASIRLAPPAARPGLDKTAAEQAERERLAGEVKRRETELAALEGEKQRLLQERQAQEQAMAARLGTLIVSPPERAGLPLTAPPRSDRVPVERRPAEALVSNKPSTSVCSEILLRAQIGDLSAANRELLLQCR
ncbi:caspase family protein [Bosea sp. PAMC 26642]|uniref:caspase family protein n=1 Tax=Bosea sp. (strain PAMC 26642) TaxID=1792307 RepID=UPI000770286E|nr:caspase family protein [Bosea sp. PAMC 26642]AMJ62799.1 hypothetical protein AXW83_23135 [Bosea sp. PAMC 26642]